MSDPWEGWHPIGAGDGTVERIWRRGAKPVAAMFIHAGAGYHSLVNEKIHLEACSESVGPLWSQDVATNRLLVGPLAWG